MTHPISGEAVAVELREGLPVRELHARLRLCLALHEVGHRGLAFYLADMDERGLHQTTGHRTASHYAEGHLEVSRRHAQELVRIGKALRTLPAIDEAFAAGTISWSKVVLLTRVVTPEHEAAWLERALQSTCRELRHAVRLAKPGSAPRRPGDTKGLPEVRYDIRARVDVLAHRTIELAREKLSAERGEPVDDATLLSIAAELILGSDENGELPGRERIDGSLYRIVIHANDDAATGDAATGDAATGDAATGDVATRGAHGPLTLGTREGRMPLEDATSDAAQRACLLCDGACSPAEGGVDSVAEGAAGGRSEGAVPDVATPPALRRRVLARDDHSCRCCGSRYGLMVHHIHYRSRGGRTRASNLITLCSRCHALVHADLLVLAGDHAERITFRDVDGRPLEGRPPDERSPTERSPTERSREAGRSRAHAGIVISRAYPESTDGPTSAGVPLAGPGPGDDVLQPVPFEEAFAGIVGQDERLARLRWTLRGRRSRGACFPHTLFAGPAGTGKTTIARALAAHAGAAFVEASGPTLRSVADVESLLARVPAGGMLFLDEIHAVPRVALERLYAAMDASAAMDATAVMDSSATVDPGAAMDRGVAGLTVLAATTDAGDLPAALRSRFGRIEALDTYDEESLAAIACEVGRHNGARIEGAAAQLLARHARGTPRELVLRTLDAIDRVASRPDARAAADGRDAMARRAETERRRATELRVTRSDARDALRALGYDAEGFGPLDRRYLRTLRAQGGPVALRRLACMLGVGASTLQACVEPFLAGRGLVRFTPRGRVATAPLRRLASG